MKNFKSLRKFCSNKKTALYSLHKDTLNAKMVSFAGNNFDYLRI